MSASAENIIVFATELATGRARHVREVKTGLACGCICPGCQEPLEAVNAESVRYVRRPHFRHVERPIQASCADHSILAALRSAAQTVKGVRVPGAPPAISELFPGLAQAAQHELAVEKFEIIDLTEALLQVPGGHMLRVILAARSWGDGIAAANFDLQVLLPDESVNLQSVDDLARYLALDQSCWRWCRRQIAPSLITSDPPFNLESQLTPVAGNPRQDAVEDASTERPRPVRSWTETATFPGIGTVLYHREIWPNGVMTERREHLG